MRSGQTFEINVILIVKRKKFILSRFHCTKLYVKSQLFLLEIGYAERVRLCGQRRKPSQFCLYSIQQTAMKTLSILFVFGPTNQDMHGYVTFCDLLSKMDLDINYWYVKICRFFFNVPSLCTLGTLNIPFFVFISTLSNPNQLNHFFFAYVRFLLFFWPQVTVFCLDSFFVYFLCVHSYCHYLSTYVPITSPLSSPFR